MSIVDRETEEESHERDLSGAMDALVYAVKSNAGALLDREQAAALVAALRVRSNEAYDFLRRSFAREEREP